MKVPKRSLMVFCMFSVHSQLHWSFISRHKMFKATSARAVSAAHKKLCSKHVLYNTEEMTAVIAGPVLETKSGAALKW